MRSRYTIGVLLFIAGILVAYAFLNGSANDLFLRKGADLGGLGDDKRHLLLNPAVTANLGKHYIVNIAPLREKFAAIQQEYQGEKYIYFLYLNNGVWVGVNEREKFQAASTLKVPLTMSVLKSEESGRIELDAPYTIEENELDGKFGELYKKGAGGEYTMRDLLKIMLEQSDNTAMNAVYNSLTRLGVADPLADVYMALGWQDLEPPAFDEAPNYEDINLKTLANMFVALYNATYLSPENSELVLSYLAQTPFDDKIAAGVPKGIVVSHKIGIGGDTNTFSDCGIVYAPNRNYLLCVGAQGMKESTANNFMGEISSAAYDFVINN